METVHTGDLRLRRIGESMGPAFAPGRLFPGFDPSLLDSSPELRHPGFLHAESGKLISSIHGWLFRAAGKTILVDTGMGRGKKSLASVDEAPFFASLAELGVAREEVDIVFLTHLHTDHMRGTTIEDGGKWVPAFPNARYIAGRREFAHWQPGGAGIALYPEQEDILAETVVPLVEAGVLDLIEDDAVILPGVAVRPTPGHTATQLALLVDTDTLSLVFAADALHHPLQVLRPDLGSFLCEDGPSAERSRLELLAHCADTGALLLASHFGPPHALRIERRGEGYGFVPVELT